MNLKLTKKTLIPILCAITTAAIAQDPPKVEQPAPTPAANAPVPVLQEVNPLDGGVRPAKRGPRPPTAQNRIDPTTGLVTPAPSPDEPKTDVRFIGGTPGELVITLEKAFGSKPNIIISPSLQSAQIPGFELHNVTLEDIFNGLNLIGRANEAGWNWTMSRDYTSIWTLVPIKPNPQPIVYGAVPSQPMIGQPRRVQIFNVARLLEKYKIEDITTAVETAWQMQKPEAFTSPGGSGRGGFGGNRMPGPAKPALLPALKFHQDTQLLIAIGDPEDIGVVSQVLGMLEQGLVADAPPKRSPRPVPLRTLPAPEPLPTEKQ
jgi:hypothetical protein